MDGFAFAFGIIPLNGVYVCVELSLLAATGGFETSDSRDDLHGCRNNVSLLETPT